MVDKKKALNKLMAQCARREICSHDAREKLRKMDLSEPEIQTILKQLIDNQFVDDERYAKAFVREKLEINRWGWNKIKYTLRMKGIDESILGQLTDETSKENYARMLDELLQKKLRSLAAEEDSWRLRAKLIRFAASRGFEPALVYERVDILLNEKN